MINQKITVVITTYNRPNALRWVLAGILNQTLTPALIVIADDGSNAETADVVKSIQKTRLGALPLIRHIWQPDVGFRAGQIRNKGVAACLKENVFANGQIIFLDGDCIPLPDFVARHAQLLAESGEGWCIAGGRALLNKDLTEILEKSPPNPSEEIYVRKINLPSIMKWRLLGQVNRVLPLISLPGIRWRRQQSQRWDKFRTCNVSLWSKDFLMINGFDEDYIGWGFEDSDLAIRLLRLGVRILNGRHATNVLHLWHPDYSRDALKQNKAHLTAAWSRPARAKNGIVQYL
jgi:glycosyltransferase involved in cell wall biosynthesis